MDVIFRNVKPEVLIWKISNSYYGKLSRIMLKPHKTVWKIVGNKPGKQVKDPT